MEKTGSKLTDMPDKELIRLALEQNQAAYIVLYTRYNVGVRNHIAKYVSQNEDIEDIMLESFQKAFSQIGLYNPEYRFSTWLFRMAVQDSQEYGPGPYRKERQGEKQHAGNIHQRPARRNR